MTTILRWPFSRLIWLGPSVAVDVGERRKRHPGAAGGGDHGAGGWRPGPRGRPRGSAPRGRRRRPSSTCETTRPVERRLEGLARRRGPRPCARARAVEADGWRRAGSPAPRRRGRPRRARRPSLGPHQLGEAAQLEQVGPKILTAMLARVPESMWSMRCEIGWPMTTLVPGIFANSSAERGEQVGLAAVLHLEADLDLGGVDALGVLVELGAAGAAGGATSGCASRIFSTMPPSAKDCSSEVPGSVTAATVSVPSLNSGRKVRPGESSPHRLRRPPRASRDPQRPRGSARARTRS
jgi:hypothetical protein